MTLSTSGRGIFCDPAYFVDHDLCEGQEYDYRGARKEELFPVDDMDIPDEDGVDGLLLSNRVYREEVYQNAGAVDEVLEESRTHSSLYVENNIIFEYQEEFRRLLKVGNKDDLFDVRRLSSNPTKVRHYVDNLELYKFSKDAGLSESQEDSLLRMVGNIMVRGNCDSAIRLTGRSFISSCGRKGKLKL